MNRPNYPLRHVMDNIISAARVRPIVIQSLFLRLDAQGPEQRELLAYIDRLKEILAAGGKIGHVQVYTVARRPPPAPTQRHRPFRRRSRSHPRLGSGASWTAGGFFLRRTLDYESDGLNRSPSHRRIERQTPGATWTERCSRPRPASPPYGSVLKS